MVKRIISTVIKEAVTSIYEDIHNTPDPSKRIMNVNVDRYSKPIEGASVDIEVYKKDILVDLLALLSEHTKKLVADCACSILGSVPDHLKDNDDFFKNFQYDNSIARHKNLYPVDLLNCRNKDNRVIPLMSYKLLTVPWFTPITNYTQYSILSFLLWYNRFEKYIEFRRTGNLIAGYTCNYDELLVQNSEEFNNARDRKFIKSHKWIKQSRYNDMKGYWGTPGWIGNLIYKPDFNDRQEVNSLIRKLLVKSSSGRKTKINILRSTNNTFDKFCRVLKTSGEGLFNFEILSNKSFACKDSPDKFKKMAESFANLSKMALELSKEFQAYKDSKLIGKRTSPESMVSKLLTDEVMANPMRYFSDESFRPNYYGKMDSILFWISKELLTGV